MDAKVDKTGDTFSGPVNMANNKITSNFKPETPDTLVNKSYADTIVNNIDEVKVNRAGDIITGNLDMNNNRITNVKHPPESNADVITKEYCDSFGENLRVNHVVANDIALQHNIDEKTQC